LIGEWFFWWQTLLIWSFQGNGMASSQNGNGSNNSLGEEKCPGFCAIRNEGGTQSLCAKNVEAFLPLIAQASIAWVDYIVNDFDKEAMIVANKVGFSETLVRRLLKEPVDRSRARSGYEDLDSEMGLLLPSIHVNNFDVVIEPLLILLKKNLVLTIHTRELTHFYQLHRYAGGFLKKLPDKMQQTDWLTLLLLRIIDENNSMNFEQVAVIDEAGDEVSRELADLKTSRALLGGKIYQMKHALVSYLLGLWATVDALSSLRYGDADLITDNNKLLNRIGIVVNEVHVQIGLAENLSQVLASGLEVLQSIYANQLQLINNKITMMVGVLTIIGTALLVPNTLATIFSQTNIFVFTPADTWWYITLLAGSTFLATSGSWWWVRKIGFLPKNPDQQ
jgi:magnesium transporter